LSVTAVLALATGLGAQSGSSRSGARPDGPRQGGLASIDAASMKEWLTYIASDELQGREVYTEGLGLAASYIADRLAEWGVKPGVADGTYFQTVKVVGLRNNSHSSVTVEVKGKTRTFKDGEGVTFPRNSGAAQTVASSDVRFVGYGLPISADEDADAARSPKGAVAVWMGSSGPAAAGDVPARALNARSRVAVEQGAVAVIGARSSGRGGRGRTGTGPDFTTVQRYDLPVPPIVSAEDEFFEFLFSGSDTPYSVLRDLAARRDPLPRFALEGVTLTFNVAPEYSIATTRFSRNVVGVIEGSDPRLKNTYVAFGAHYDHIGYQENHPQAVATVVSDPGGCKGQTRRGPRPGDIIYNGADDDGSGTVALMAMARAFALGPKPARSLVFVWHTAEESGLQGSRYNADFPVVPNEQIVAQLNVDMIGRNRCDDPSEADKVYLVGSDRISTELHNVSEEANAGLPRPMTLDYELNDPADPESLYTRSDHYSYAAKGIPVIFYTTGLHKDYHYLTDEIDLIEFEKMARVTRLIYATGERLANLEHAPVRDNKGPRAVKGSRGKLSPAPDGP
jgi:hypothetical protein